MRTQMQVRKEDVVKYFPKEEGQHFKRKTLLSSSAVMGIRHQNFILNYCRGFFYENFWF